MPNGVDFIIIFVYGPLNSDSNSAALRVDGVAGDDECRKNLFESAICSV